MEEIIINLEEKFIGGIFDNKDVKKHFEKLEEVLD